ncbi:hypothetical protein D3C77_610250 [compost metagenome]
MAEGEVGVLRCVGSQYVLTHPASSSSDHYSAEVVSGRTTERLVEEGVQGRFGGVLAKRRT